MSKITYHDSTPSKRAFSLPSCYIQAHLHPVETFGNIVARELIQLIKTTYSPINLRIVPLSNPYGWRNYVDNGDQRKSKHNNCDWNRLFNFEELDYQSNLEEDQLNIELFELSRDFDIIIDLHTPEFGLPHVYVENSERRLITFDDLPHVAYKEAKLGPFDETHILFARAQGHEKLAVTLELPSFTLSKKENAEYWANRLFNELVQISKGNLPDKESTPIVGSIEDIIPEEDGIINLRSTPGELVKRNKTIADLVKITGDIDQLSVPFDSIPLCFRRKTIVEKNKWAIRTLKPFNQ